MTNPMLETSFIESLPKNKREAVKLIAMYFPQFHSIPKNDAWWGKGFTDWNNVKSGAPEFKGHYQPRIPLNSNYYDQSRIETIRWQVDLAAQHGIFGFCHYHYWFDGTQLLETPTNLMLANKDIDFPFCLSWANETWSRRWDGRDHHILIQQTHPPKKESWKKHFDYLIRVWKDPRAIRVEDKPVFVIYRPHRINHIDDMLDYWREEAHKEGLPGIYILAQKQYEFPNRACLKSFDGVFQFQPFEAIHAPGFNKKSIRHSLLFKILRALPERAQDLLRGIRAKFVKELTFYDYDLVWEAILNRGEEEGLHTYPGAFVDWDNTARYKHRATVFRGASPSAFHKWLSQLVATMPNRHLPENFIFLNAWNEWSESAYLEPDERHGLEYLSAISDIVLSHPQKGVQIFSANA